MKSEIKVSLCEQNIIHPDAVDKAKKNLIADDKVAVLSDFFKVFSDPTRLKILMLLTNTELCVCDIMAGLGLKQSTVSQQLRLLRQMRLVKHHQEGKQVFYSLDDDHIYIVLKMGIQHIDEEMRHE